MSKLLQRVRLSVSISAALTLLVGLGLTALLFASVRRIETSQQQHQFRQNALLRSTAVETGLADAVEQMAVVNQLFQTIGSVDRQQFHDFTAPLLQRYPAIQALSFQRLLRVSDRVGYETRMRQRYPDFHVAEFIDGKPHAAGARDSYYVVDYIEPAAGNGAALGIDTAVAPMQAQARRRARASGLPAATGLATNDDAAAIAVAIISLAHSLRLKVIAEGVETAEQLAFLRTHGCDQMQGYYFSKPLSAADFGQLLQVHRRLPLPGPQTRQETLPGIEAQYEASPSC